MERLDSALPAVRHGKHSHLRVRACMTDAFRRPRLDLRAARAPLEGVDCKEHARRRGGDVRLRNEIVRVRSVHLLECPHASIFMRIVLHALTCTHPREERAQRLSAFALQHAGGHVEMVVQPRVLVHTEKRARRASLGVGRTIYAAIHARVHHKARAHEARLERHVHRATREPPTTERMGSLEHRQEFRVRGRIFVQLAPVVCARNHLVFIHHDGADGHLAQLGGGLRLGKRLAHEALVLLVHIHIRPSAANPFERCYHYLSRRDGRAVECGGLENRWARERLEGSNPSLSAMRLARPAPLWCRAFC